MSYTPKRRITIIEDDDLVIIDGHQISMAVGHYLAAEVWALQWDVQRGQGHIEYNDHRPNTDIDSLAPYQTLIALACQQIQTQIDAETAQQVYVNSFEVKQAALIQTISETAQAFVDQAISNTYPMFEQQTFAIQRAEALAWAADKTAATSNIDVLARHRGLERVTLLEKVLAKVAQFQTLTFWVSGQRQAKVDQAKAATTVAELAAIDLSYTLPSTLPGTLPTRLAVSA